MKLIRGTIYNLAVLAMMYFAAWGENIYCYRIFRFYTCVILLVAVALSFSQQVRDSIIKDNKPFSIPGWLNNLFNAAQLAILVPAAWYWSAALFFWMWMLEVNLKAEKEKFNQAISA